MAATRLAEVAHEETRRRFAGIQQQWLDVLAEEVGPEMAKAVRYMGDGLYFNAMLEGGAGDTEVKASARSADVGALLAAVDRLRD
ncbi:hypothetical protein AHiyo8_23210 [Arthrobacter sp. Hiyo8]|nr:hypothetical protein AHiyo8_23210 [Arthrobacter sp. Hiyo8]